MRRCDTAPDIEVGIIVKSDVAVDARALMPNNIRKAGTMIWIYRIFFPLAFLFFVPGLIIKLIRRPGRKGSTYR